MLRIIKTFFLSVICTLLLTGCGNVIPYEEVHTDLVGSYTLSNVEKAILTAGRARQWVMKVEEPGVIEGTLHVRSHMAVIKVTYTTQSYTIGYVDSENLKMRTSEAGTPLMISANFMKWIRTLDKDIQRQLTIIGQ